MLNKKTHSNNFDNIIDLLKEEKKYYLKDKFNNFIFEATSSESSEDFKKQLKETIKDLNSIKSKIPSLNSHKFHNLLKEVKKAEHEYIGEDDLKEFSDTVYNTLLKNKDVNQVIKKLVFSSIEKSNFKDLFFHIINETSSGKDIQKSKSFNFKKNLADYPFEDTSATYSQDHLPKLYSSFKAVIEEEDVKEIIHFIVNIIINKYLSNFIDFDLGEKQNSFSKITKYFRINSSEIQIETGKESNFRRICNNIIIDKTKIVAGQKNRLSVYIPFYDQAQIEGTSAKILLMKTGEVKKGDEIFRLEMPHKDKTLVAPKTGEFQTHYLVKNGIATTRFYSPIDGNFIVENVSNNGNVNFGSKIGYIEEKEDVKKVDFLTSAVKVKPDYSITHFFLNHDDYLNNQGLKNILFSPIEILNFTDNKAIIIRPMYHPDDIVDSKFNIENFDSDQNFISPFDIFVLIAFKLVNKYSSFTFELIKANLIQEYDENVQELHVHFSSFDSKKLEQDQKDNKIIFKSGESAKRAIKFLEDLNLKSEQFSNGALKNDVMSLFFDTSLETADIKSFLNDVLSKDSALPSSNISSPNKKLSVKQIRNLEEICLEFFNKSGYGIGNGEYFLIALLMGVDIPATLALTLEKGKDKHSVDEVSKKIESILDKLSIYHGGQESIDIDFKTHTLPPNCPTKSLIEGKMFEVKEVSKSSSNIRVGSEGIRSLSTHISKFYIKTNEVKKFLFNTEKEQRELTKEKKLYSLINHFIDTSDFYGVRVNNDSIKDIFKKFHKDIDCADEDQAKTKIKKFLLDFYSTNLTNFIQDQDEASDSDSEVSQVHNFDAGNFNLKRLRLIYVSHLCIMEALKIIIDLLSYTDNNLNLNIDTTNFSLPIRNVDLYKSNEKITSFDFHVRDVLNVINDKQIPSEDIKKLGSESAVIKERISHSGEVLSHAVKLYNNLKSLNLSGVFKITTGESGHLNFVENFGDIAKAFEKVDGLFIVKGMLTDDLQAHSDIRMLFVPKQQIKNCLELHGASQHRPNFALSNNKNFDISVKEFFDLIKSTQIVKV